VSDVDVILLARALRTIPEPTHAGQIHELFVEDYLAHYNSLLPPEPDAGDSISCVAGYRVILKSEVYEKKGESRWYRWQISVNPSKQQEKE